MGAPVIGAKPQERACCGVFLAAPIKKTGAMVQNPGLFPPWLLVALVLGPGALETTLLGGDYQAGRRPLRQYPHGSALRLASAGNNPATRDTHRRTEIGDCPYRPAHVSGDFPIRGPESPQFSDPGDFLVGPRLAMPPWFSLKKCVCQWRSAPHGEPPGFDGIGLERNRDRDQLWPAIPIMDKSS